MMSGRNDERDMTASEGVALYRAFAERLMSCTCGSTAAIDPARHAENCHRRLWREAMDEIDAYLATYNSPRQDTVKIPSRCRQDAVTPVGRRWTAYVCPICQDGPNLGPVSGREWSCSNGHSPVDAVEVEVIPASHDQGAVSALRKIDALLDADMNRGAMMVRLEQIVADALATAERQ